MHSTRYIMSCATPVHKGQIGHSLQVPLQVQWNLMQCAELFHFRQAAHCSTLNLHNRYAPKSLNCNQFKIIAFDIEYCIAMNMVVSDIYWKTALCQEVECTKSARFHGRRQLKTTVSALWSALLLVFPPINKYKPVQGDVLVFCCRLD